MKYHPIQGAKRKCLHPAILAPSSAGPRGTLFLVLMWAAFLLPSANWGTFPFIIGHTNLSELALILMPSIYAMYPRQRAVWHTKALRFAIIAFFAACILSNVLQYLLYGGNITAFSRAHRSLIPLYCAIALLYLGPRVRPNLLIANLGACLSISFIVSLVFFLFDLDFKPFFQAEFTEGAYKIIRSGRLYNVNAGFGYLALAIIAAFSYYRKKVKLNRSTLLLVLASALSILTSILTYNRTFLIISPLLIITLLLLFFRLRVVLYFTLTVSLAVSLGLYSYREAETVQRQVDRRIIIPLKHQKILENVYYGKREVLYQGYFDVAKEYLLTGVPPHVPWCVVGIQSREIMTTDTSFATVILRNGIFSFLLYFCVGWVLYRNLWKMRNQNKYLRADMLRRSLLIAIPFMVIASFNIDVLARHYSVVFLALFVVSLRDDRVIQKQ